MNRNLPNDPRLNTLSGPLVGGPRGTEFLGLGHRAPLAAAFRDPSGEFPKWFQAAF